MKKILILSFVLVLSLLSPACVTSEETTSDAGEEVGAESTTSVPETQNENDIPVASLSQTGELCSTLKLDEVSEEEWIREPVNPYVIAAESTKGKLRGVSSDSCIVQGLTSNLPFEVSAYTIDDPAFLDAFMEEISASYIAQGKGNFESLPGGFRVRTSSDAAYFSDTIVYRRDNRVFVIFSPADPEGNNGIYNATLTS